MTDVQPREVKILETAEDIQLRREEVISRYGFFRNACKDRRERLEDSRRYQFFKRDADELESWIYEKLQTASDENYKDPTNLQVTSQLLIIILCVKIKMKGRQTNIIFQFAFSHISNNGHLFILVFLKM